MPRCLVVQHLPPEGPYAIGQALVSAGVEVDIRRVFSGEELPLDLAGFDGLVVMGGPMSASSDEDFPSRRLELTLLAEALERQVPTLGVCLGAQLLALAGGGAVSRGAVGPEVGWGSVDLTPQAADDALLGGLPDQLTVLHWHWDTFDLPPQAVHLAASVRYANQAFRSGARAWGLQFHVEVDEQAVASFVAEFGADALHAATSPEAITAATPVMLDALGAYRSAVLERFAQMVASEDREQLAEAP